MCSLEVNSLATIFNLIIYLPIAHIQQPVESYLAEQVLIFLGLKMTNFHGQVIEKNAQLSCQQGQRRTWIPGCSLRMVQGDLSFKQGDLSCIK